MAIDEHKDSIAALCRDLGRRAPYSAARVSAQFKPMPAAQYHQSQPRRAAGAFQTPVDLVSGSRHNYFKEAVRESRLPVYELSRS
jgi:hypothetical protein